MAFKKILIANRGEIACRIIKTCKDLGIHTISIYSTADENFPHVKEADESIHIGESPAHESYLNIEKIMKIAKENNVDAIHPGYGFLSEDPNFARKCAAENITYIGPDADIIELMGDKLKSREKMREAGVPLIPGSQDLHSLDEAKLAAKELGYPLMLKASAGGGGIGLNIIKDEEELEQRFEVTVQKIGELFGNDTVYLEKLILHPRHIEVQVVGDRHGNVLHLFERECSIQRRHQKIIEETPSPYLDETLRKKLYETAVRGAEAIGYNNVGTMEFIFDGDKNFYFLEMNPRLQVEHTITEEITRIDLVEWQLQISAGKELPIKQADIEKKGHAIQGRVYSEDPKTLFPSPGTVTKLSLGDEDARYDFGIIEDSFVSPFYDPMVGKVITHAASREKAMEKMRVALKNTEIEGIKTNIPLLLQTLENDHFVLGDYTTSFVETQILQR